MFRLTLQFNLLDPIVISQSNATEGMHKSLDYIPGANILGALAATAYKTFKKETAIEIFHTGNVRFGNAYPTINLQNSYPIPLSFHYSKGKDKHSISNLINVSPKAGEQPKQHRNGYINAENKLTIPEKLMHLRTAINAETGTAKSGQLFGYQSLKPGITMQANIDSENQELLTKISTILPNKISFGRSRTAHYGRVKVTQNPIQIIKTDWSDDKRLILWLASDLVCYNQNNQPNLQPTLADLGLNENIPLNLKESYIRTRKYAPYNGFRRSYDLERQIIQQGSVLIYNLNKALTKTDKTQLYKGLGCYTESGQGQVVPLNKQSAFLNTIKSSTLQLQSNAPAIKLADTETTENQPLINYLRQQQKNHSINDSVAIAVATSIDEMMHLYKNVRAYNGIQNSTNVGPSKTQWGNIRDIISKQMPTSHQQIESLLFKNEEAPIKDNDEQWSQQDHDTSFSKKFKNLLKQQDESNIALYTRVFAKKMAEQIGETK